MSPFLVVPALFAITCLACTEPLDDEFGEESAEILDAVIPSDGLWPGGDVYILKRYTDAALVEQVAQTKKRLEQETAVRLHIVERRSEVEGRHWVKLVDSSGGGTAWPGITHPRSKADSDAEAFEHELGHILGLRHTQARVDRDDHVTVHPNFIQSDYAYAFAIDDDAFLIGPYRSSSVMHYASWMFQARSDCASISLGTNNEEECVPEGDPRYYEEETLYYTVWNFSVLSAMYCDERVCGDSCAEEARCQTPAVQRNLQRLYSWEASAEGKALRDSYPENALPAR